MMRIKGVGGLQWCSDSDELNVHRNEDIRRVMTGGNSGGHCPDFQKGEENGNFDLLSSVSCYLIL